MNRVLPNKGETKSLIIQNSCIEEVNRLQEICNTWDDKMLIEGEMFPDDYILKCLTIGDLPPIPNASQDSYSLKSILVKETGNIIGFFDVYAHFPTKGTLWTSIFMFDKVYRQKGYGKEVTDYIALEARKSGFSKSSIGVQLKNWPALRFWTKNGYDKIFGIFGDETYSPGAFAQIGLEKAL